MGALCPKIKNVNKTPGMTLRKMFENVRCRTLPHVSTVPLSLSLSLSRNRVNYETTFLLIF